MSGGIERVAVAIEADQPRRRIAASLERAVPGPIETAESLAELGGILTHTPPDAIVLADDVGNRPFAATKSRTEAPIVALVGLSADPDRFEPDRVEDVVEVDARRIEETAERLVGAVELIGMTGTTSSEGNGPGDRLERTDGAASDRQSQGTDSSVEWSSGEDGGDRISDEDHEESVDSRSRAGENTHRTDDSPEPRADPSTPPGTLPIATDAADTTDVADSTDGAETTSGADATDGADTVSSIDLTADDTSTTTQQTGADTEQTGPFVATGAVEPGSISGTVVIGASTGGPGVVTSVLSALPVETGLRILLVQHLRDAIVPQFADRIDEATAFDVSVATDGGTVSPGEVLVARGNSHLVVERDTGEDLRVRCVEAPPRNDVRPAADETMESAADVVDGPLVGVLLTGIGVDGAAGLQSIKRAGGRTIAQDEATSNIFGMPAAAIESGAVDDVLPGDRIANGIVRSVVEQQE